jgi:hypothetical protein
MDGLIVGMDMIVKFCGTRKYRKRIFLVTDGERKTNFSEDEFEEIAKTIKENDLKLNVITLDFCNELEDDDSEEEDGEAEPAGGDENMEDKQKKKEKESDETEE